MNPTPEFWHFLKYIGNRIYLARHARREKITTAANNIGISHPTLSQIENGRYKPLSVKLICKILYYYELELGEFLKFPENEK